MDVIDGRDRSMDVIDGRDRSMDVIYGAPNAPKFIKFISMVPQCHSYGCNYIINCF